MSTRGPDLEPGVSYTKLPASTRFADLRPGDRVVYHHRTYEVLTPPKLSASGKKVFFQWRMVAVKAGPYASYYTEQIGKAWEYSGFTKTTTGRVVHRPKEFIEFYIDEDAFELASV